MDGNRTMPSSEEVVSLEEYIPTRLTTFTVLKCTIIIPVAEFNLLDHLMPVIMGEKVCMHCFLIWLGFFLRCGDTMTLNYLDSIIDDTPLVSRYLTCAVFSYRMCLFTACLCDLRSYVYVQECGK